MADRRLVAVQIRTDAQKDLVTDEEGRLLVSTGGFSSDANITTTIVGDVITQTDGVKTYTITISGGTITEEWS